MALAGNVTRRKAAPSEDVGLAPDLTALVAECLNVSLRSFHELIKV